MEEASPVAQTVKNLPAMQKIQVRSLGREDPLEEGMATHSSVLAWRIAKDRRAWWATVHWVPINIFTFRCSADQRVVPGGALSWLFPGLAD